MFQDSNPIFEFRGPWGVPVQIGASLILLFLLIVDLDGGPVSLAYGLMFFAILIGSIFLHELGHAWGCLIQGVPVTRIMIFGGGGFCERSRSASRYEQELIVAMGPIVNLVLWAVASLVSPYINDPEIGWAIDTIAYVNLFLVILNLLPVHPLDGGKLFQLLLYRVLPTGVAVRISGAVGLLISILWIPAMLWAFANLGLFLIFFPSPFVHWHMLMGRTA